MYNSGKRSCLLQCQGINSLVLFDCVPYYGLHLLQILLCQVYQIHTCSHVVPAAKQSGHNAQQQGSPRSVQAGTPPLSPFDAHDFEL